MSLPVRAIARISGTFGFQVRLVFDGEPNTVFLISLITDDNLDHPQVSGSAVHRGVLADGCGLADGRGLIAADRVSRRRTADGWTPLRASSAACSCWRCFSANAARMMLRR